MKQSSMDFPLELVFGEKKIAGFQFFESKAQFSSERIVVKKAIRLLETADPPRFCTP